MMGGGDRSREQPLEVVRARDMGWEVAGGGWGEGGKEDPWASFWSRDKVLQEARKSWGVRSQRREGARVGGGGNAGL